MYREEGSIMSYSIGVIIPTYNSGNIATLLSAINNQSCNIDYKLIIDSSSTDNTVEIAKKYGWIVKSIRKESFGHGKTRKYACDLIKDNLDILIYLTQDVEIKDKDCLRKILQYFNDEKIGAAYGRQLPKENASFEAKTLREFNYPSKSHVRNLDDANKYGIKTAFLSDSFAAYRIEALNKSGGFPNNTNISEDMYVGAKMLLSGYKIAYAADAVIYHSHNFTLKQYWMRYYEIGVFHSKEHWLLETLGKAEGEGIKLLLYQLKLSLINRKPIDFIKVIIISAIKFIAYKKGFSDNEVIECCTSKK